MQYLSFQLSRIALLPILLVISSVGLASSGEGAGRDLVRAAPADVGMSVEGLARIKDLMRTLVDGGELSGAITAVSRYGKLVYWDVQGYQDQEKGTPLTDDTIFRIHSMTKPVTGVALMTLYEEGKFQLDDPVAKYIPQLEGLQVATGDGPDGVPLTEKANHPLTIRELVSHTGGLTYGLFARSQVDSLYQQADILNRDQSLEQFIDKLATLPLKSQPGSRWEYSVGVDVQGYLVQVLAGQPFEEVLAQRIFEPLGMVDTAFWVPPEKAERLATLYSRSKPLPLGPSLSQPNFPSGGGGLVSTAMDFLRFAQMLANGGELDGTRILQPETVKLMHTNQLPDSIKEINARRPGTQWGVDFALINEPDGETTHTLARGEFNWYGIGGAWFGINPIQNLVVVGMIQNLGSVAARTAKLESKRLAYDAIVVPD